MGRGVVTFLVCAMGLLCGSLPLFAWPNDNKPITPEEIARYEEWERKKAEAEAEGVAYYLEKLALEPATVKLPEENWPVTWRRPVKFGLALIDNAAWERGLEILKARRPEFTKMLEDGKKIRDTFYDAVDAEQAKLQKQIGPNVRVTQQMIESVQSYRQAGAPQDPAKMDPLLAGILAREEVEKRDRTTGYVADLNRQRQRDRLESQLLDQEDFRRKKKRTDAAELEAFRLWQKEEIKRLEKGIKTALRQRMRLLLDEGVYSHSHGKALTREEIDAVEIHLPPYLDKEKYGYHAERKIEAGITINLPGEEPTALSMRWHLMDEWGHPSRTSNESWKPLRTPAREAAVRMDEILSEIIRSQIFGANDLMKIEATAGLDEVRRALENYEKALGFRTNIVEKAIERNYFWVDANITAREPHPLHYLHWFFRNQDPNYINKYSRIGDSNYPSGTIRDGEAIAAKKMGLDLSKYPPHRWREQVERQKRATETAEKKAPETAVGAAETARTATHHFPRPAEKKNWLKWAAQGAMAGTAVGALSFFLADLLPPREGTGSAPTSLVADQDTIARNSGAPGRGTGAAAPVEHGPIFEVRRLYGEIPNEHLLADRKEARSSVALSRWGVQPATVIDVKEKQPLDLAAIPTAEGSHLLRLDVYGPAGKLAEGKDYEVKRTTSGQYLLEAKGANASLPVTIEAGFGRAAKGERPATNGLPDALRDIAPVKLKALSAQLRKDGFGALSDGIDARVATGHATSIYDLEQIFSASAVYDGDNNNAETSGIRKAVGKVFGASRFAPFRPFLGEDGVLHYECDGAAGIFGESLKFLFEGDPRVQLRSESLYALDNPLEAHARNRHRRNRLSFTEGNRKIEVRLDATPTGGEPPASVVAVRPPAMKVAETPTHHTEPPSAGAEAPKTPTAPTEPHGPVRAPFELPRSPGPMYHRFTMRRRGVLTDLTGDPFWENDFVYYTFKLWELAEEKRAALEAAEAEKLRLKEAEERRAQEEKDAAERARLQALLKGETPVEAPPAVPVSDIQRRARLKSLVEALTELTELASVPQIGSRLPRSGDRTLPGELSTLVRSLSRHLVGEIPASRVTPFHGGEVHDGTELNARLATYATDLENFFERLERELAEHRKRLKVNPKAKLPKWAEESRILGYVPLKEKALEVTKLLRGTQWEPFADAAGARTACGIVYEKFSF